MQAGPEPQQPDGHDVGLHTHVLPAHVVPTPQTVPHAPQLASSLVRSTHTVPHFVYPLLHAKVQLLVTHAGCACTTLVAQALPHAEQLFALLVVSTQAPLHSDGVEPEHPVAHA
jgi:hypothetical protein